MVEQRKRLVPKLRAARQEGKQAWIAYDTLCMNHGLLLKVKLIFLDMCATTFIETFNIEMLGDAVEALCYTIKTLLKMVLKL